MPEPSKVTAGHQRRSALVYIRQSTMNQVEGHRESTARQYALVEQAQALGWHPDQLTVIDADHGISGASASNRNGFARSTAEVALGIPRHRTRHLCRQRHGTGHSIIWQGA